MIDKLLQIVAPDHCYGCGQTGALICNNCKYDIINEPFSGCIDCRKPTRPSGICRTCFKLPFDKAWAAGERSAALEALLDGYKFRRQRSAAKTLAELLDDTLPLLPSQTVIVPVPTIAKHVRQRGYDHTFLIAAELARLRGLSYQAVIGRKSQFSQRDADRKTRFSQAKRAFKLVRSVDTKTPYLVVDDIYTTGATMRFAAKTLKDNGAREVWAAVIARQPLD